MTKSADKTADLVLLGRVSGAFGIQGWVKLHSYTEPREGILDYRKCQLISDGSQRELEWAEGRRQGKTVVARAKGVADRDAAERLIGAEIGVRREEMPDAGKDSYYWADLQGLAVVHRDGRLLGKVERLMATGANDVLVVKGDREILIPFVIGRYVLGVDLAESRIQVDWEWD